jgi:hypothetical protein
MYLLCLTIFITSIPILNSLRVIKSNTSELKKNTTEIVNKIKQVDLMISNKIKKLDSILKLMNNE